MFDTCIVCLKKIYILYVICYYMFDVPILYFYGFASISVNSNAVKTNSYI